MQLHNTKEIFSIVELEEEKKKQFKIVVGNNIVSQKEFKSLQAAKDYIAQKPYELIFNTMFVILQNFEKNENNPENPTNVETN